MICGRCSDAAGMILESRRERSPCSRSVVVEIQAKIRPTREVGGNFYDFFRLDDDRLGVVIGDVCGKGIPASLFMAVVVTVLRTAAREEPGAASTIARANAILSRDNAASLFATAFYAVLTCVTGLSNIAIAGITPQSFSPPQASLAGLPPPDFRLVCSQTAPRLPPVYSSIRATTSFCLPTESQKLLTPQRSSSAIPS